MSIARRKFRLPGHWRRARAGCARHCNLPRARRMSRSFQKCFRPVRTTVAAQGGMKRRAWQCAAGQLALAHVRHHQGQRFSCDQDAVEYMCRAAPRLVIELEHYGVPFTRLENGRIYQRQFGGQSQNFGGAQAARTCRRPIAPGTRYCTRSISKHQGTYPLFRRVFRYRPAARPDGYVLGALVLEIETGEPLIIEAKTTLIATGGAARMYRTSTNAMINTGDGMAMALRAGIPLQDMEFMQFHPTGIAGFGMLITEAARGEGGYLLNSQGERFMERYAPNARDLASRDVVARAIEIEVREGRGLRPNKDYIHLKIDQPGRGADQEQAARHPRAVHALRACRSD